MFLGTLGFYFLLINFCFFFSTFFFSTFFFKTFRIFSYLGFFFSLGFFFKSSWFIFSLYCFNFYTSFSFFIFIFVLSFVWKYDEKLVEFYNHSKNLTISSFSFFIFFCYCFILYLFLKIFSIVYILPLPYFYVGWKIFLSISPLLVVYYIFTYAFWKNILTYFFEPMPYSAPRGPLFMTRVLGLFPVWIFKFPFLIGPVYLFIYINFINICIVWTISSKYAFWYLFICICIYTLFRSFRVWFLQKPSLIPRLIYDKYFVEFSDLMSLIPPVPRNIIDNVLLYFDSLFNFLLWLDYSEDYLVEVFYFVIKVPLFIYQYIARRFYSFVFLISILICIDSLFSIWYLFFFFMFCMICLSYISGFKNYLSEAFLSSFDESSVNTPELGTSLNSFLSGTSQTVLIYHLNLFFIIFAYCFLSNNLVKLNVFLKTFIKTFRLFHYKKYMPLIQTKDMNGLLFFFNICSTWFSNLCLFLNKYSFRIVLVSITCFNFFSCYFFYRLYNCLVICFETFEWNSGLIFPFGFCCVVGSFIFWSQFLYNYLQHELNFLRLLPGNNWNSHQSQVIDIFWFFYFPCFLFVNFCYLLVTLFYKLFWFLFCILVVYSLFYNWLIIYILFIYMVLYYHPDFVYLNYLNYFYFFIILTFFFFPFLAIISFLFFILFLIVEYYFSYRLITNFSYGLSFILFHGSFIFWYLHYIEVAFL